MIRNRHDDNADTYADLLGPGSPLAVARVVAALDAACACAPTPSPHAARLDAAMARTLYGQPRATARRRHAGVGMRPRLIPVAAALALTLGGLGAYLHWPAPTPVSAQSILRHTAAALSASDPGQATHDVFAVHTSWAPGVATAGLTAADLAPDTTYDAWVQRDVDGTVMHEDIKATDPHGALLMHVVQDGWTLTVYDAKTGTTTTTRQNPAAKPLTPVIPDPLDVDSLRQFVIDAQRDANQDVRALPQQTLDGSLVDVIQVSHTRPRGLQDTPATPRQYSGTLYVDARTYAFRKLEMSVSDDGGNAFSVTVQDLRHEVVPLADVPAQVFSLQAAHVSARR
jgi:outer membrane lipoprotein-sorting protein